MSENQILLLDEQIEFTDNVSIYHEFYTKIIHIENAAWCEEIEKSIEYQQQLYNKYQDHIIKIKNHEYKEDTQRYFIESQNGTPLSQLYINPNQIQNQSQCIKIVEKLFQLDQFMKKEGIHHYNIKPNNIILHDDKLKLTDFGYHNQHYLLRNFNQNNDQNFCQNNYPYLSNQVLQNIQQYSQSDVNQDFLSDDIKKNLDKIYDDSDSQSIAFIMFEILINQSIIRDSIIDWKSCDFKQLRQDKYQEVIINYKHQQNQFFFQFMELYIMNRAVDFSKFEQCNKLIDKFIQLNNFNTFEKRFMYLFNEKQLKSYYDNGTSNQVDQQNTQFVQELFIYTETLKSKMKYSQDFWKELNNCKETKLVFALIFLYEQIKCSKTQYDKNHYRLLATILENGQNINGHLEKLMNLFIQTFPDLERSDVNDQIIEFNDIDSQINLEQINQCRQFIKKEILDQNLKLDLENNFYYLFSQKQLENYQIGLNNTAIPNILEFAKQLQNSLQNEQEFKNLCSSFSKKLFAVNLLYDKITDQNDSQNTKFKKLAQQIIQQDNQFWQNFDVTFSKLKSFIENRRQSPQQLYQPPLQQPAQIPSQLGSQLHAQQPAQQPSQSRPQVRAQQPQINYINQYITITQLQDESVREFLKWQVIVKQKKYNILQPNSNSNVTEQQQYVRYEDSARTIIAIGEVEGNVFNGEVIKSQEQQKAPEKKSCFQFCQEKEKQQKKQNDKYELISKKIKIIKHYEKIKIDFIDQGDWKIQGDQDSQITCYQLKKKVIKERNIIQEKTLQSIKKIKFYQGEIFDNLENGEGKMYDFKRNIKYNGHWSEGKKNHGQLQILNPQNYLTGDFFMFEGDFQNDLFHGKGIVYLSPDKKIKQTGQFKNGNQVGIHYLYQNQKQVSRIIYCSIDSCKVKINVPSLFS